MDFNKYLLENLLDCYEEYCACTQEMSEEEIDAMYIKGYKDRNPNIPSTITFIIVNIFSLVVLLFIIIPP